MVNNSILINLIAVGLLFLYTLLIARILSPEDLGGYSVIISTSLLLSVLSTLKCELFLIKEQSDITELSRKYIKFIACLMGSIMFAVYYVYSENFVDSLLCLGLIFSTNSYDYKNYDNLSKGNLSVVAQMRLVKSVLLILFGLAAGFHANLTYVLIGEVISRVIPAIPVNFSMRVQKLHFSLKELKILIKHCALVSISWFINNAFILALPALITFIYNAQIAGIFFLTYKILSSFEVVFANIVNQLFIAKYRVETNKQKVMRGFFYFNLLSSIIFGIVILMVYRTLAHLIISLEYLDYKMALYSSLLAVSQCFSASIYVSFNLLDRESIQFIYDFFRFFCLILIGVVCLIFDYNMYIFILTIGMVNIFSSVLLGLTMLERK